MPRGVVGETYRICICGHPESVHSFVDRPKYTKCRMYQPNCNCNGGFRPVVQVEGKAVARFQRRSRGSERPHSLAGAISKTRDNGGTVTWIESLACDFCTNPVDSEEDLLVVALGRRNEPMFLPENGELSSAIDTGHHALLCVQCVSAQREIARLEAEMAKAAEDARFEEALRAAGV
jgi:hypothetical protein